MRIAGLLAWCDLFTNSSEKGGLEMTWRCSCWMLLSASAAIILSVSWHRSIITTCDPVRKEKTASSLMSHSLSSTWSNFHSYHLLLYCLYIHKEVCLQQLLWAVHGHWVLPFSPPPDSCLKPLTRSGRDAPLVAVAINRYQDVCKKRMEDRILVEFNKKHKSDQLHTPCYNFILPWMWKLGY